MDARLNLYVAHRSALVAYAERVLGSRAWAEDVVQEAYLRFVPASEAGQDFDVVLRPLGYLYRIVRNLATDWARHLAPERCYEAEEIFDAAIATSPTPEQVALNRDELRAVASALAELPERTRTAFEMSRLEHRTLREITTELGVSLTVAHELVHQAESHCASRVAPKLALLNSGRRPPAPASSASRCARLR
ncbi:MAG TPA: sigma-70 family RNA polymerase sigma factor [Polyangiaceae bacterium]|nr:sigma-70 family RNA polymerase sigma factor [Polyangiaceae bacterium]